MKARLSENMVMPMTIVNPPPVQEMNSDRDPQQPPAPGPVTNDDNSGEHTKLEMQAL